MIRDLLMIRKEMHTLAYQKSFLRATLDSELLISFVTAMKSKIEALLSGQILVFNTESLHFIITQNETGIFVLTTDYLDDIPPCSERLLKVAQIFANEFNSGITDPFKPDRTQIIESTIERILFCTLKVALVGFGGVGKTTLFRLIQGEEIPLEHIPTMFVQYKKIPTGADQLEVLLWDFAGEEKFTPIWPLLLRGTNLIFLVTDSTVENILDTKRVFLKRIKRYRPHARCIAIANKQDMPGAVKPQLIQRILGIEHVFGMCAIDPSQRRWLKEILLRQIEEISHQTEENLFSQAQLPE